MTDFSLSSPCRWSAIALAVLLASGLTACDRRGSDTPKPTTDSSTAAPSMATPPSMSSAPASSASMADSSASAADGAASMPRP